MTGLQVKIITKGFEQDYWCGHRAKQSPIGLEDIPIRQRREHVVAAVVYEICDREEDEKLGIIV